VLGRTHLQGIAERVLAEASADQTEVMIAANDSHLTRFATNTIHQNVSETDVSIRVRSVIGHKVGVASGNDPSDSALKELVERAETVARFQQENPEIASLPEPKPIEEVEAYVEATAGSTPIERAKGAKEILDRSEKSGAEAAGAFSTEAQEMMIANSRGVMAYHRGTVAEVMAVVMGKTGSGYAAEASIDVRRLNPAKVGEVAVDKAVRSADPTDIEPGEYTVILEEEAVADMVFFLGWLGMGALSVQEGRSFMTGKIGQKVTGDKITIWDDGLDPRGIPLPFDFEGVPKQKVVLIENGIAKGVVYDTFTANREGKSSTGHSLPAPNTMGPIPINLFMAPGQATKEEMLAATERGIWVTRFHYTNPVHPMKTILTGMTRDGTFLIENGKITRPLKNLRFTQSILEAFENADMLGSELKMVKSDWGSMATCAPAARIHGFTFTGTTEF